MFPEVASHGGSGISSGEGYSKNNNDGGMIQWAVETNHHSYQGKLDVMYGFRK
jgi:hypothetical protein